LLLFLTGFALSATAQKPDGSIKGKLVDSTSKAAVANATVSVQFAKDSSLATFTLSNAQGSFEIKGLADGDYRLIISSTGFEEVKRPFTISASTKSIDLGEFPLGKDYK